MLNVNFYFSKSLDFIISTMKVMLFDQEGFRGTRCCCAANNSPASNTAAPPPHTLFSSHIIFDLHLLISIGRKPPIDNVSAPVDPNK